MNFVMDLLIIVSVAQSLSIGERNRHSISHEFINLFKLVCLYSVS